MAYIVRSSLCVSLFLCVGLCAGSEVYNRTSEGLTEFPTDIPDNTTAVILVNNSISVINTVQQLPNVTLINLAKNNLSTVPDFSNVADTLKTLNLDENIISRIPIENIIPLKSLSTLSLAGNPITGLPNLGLLPPAPVLDVVLQGDEQMVCDWRMAAIMRAETAGKVTFSSGKPNCVLPTNLLGTNWASVTVADMITIGNDTSRYAGFGRVDVTSPVATYPAVTGTLGGVESEDCARMCLRSPGCTMMVTDGSTCVLTNTDVGTPGPLAPYTSWNIRL